ncbi:MAG: signal peptidase II [Proteobacteria bacterium]|nr:signal peptidase II [Pseudomonadota bacterium]MCP4916276.1 signal peptidase II [Pseudomonadota bacterium]
MSRRLSLRNGLFAVVAVVGIVLDQLTKMWVRGNLELGRGRVSVIDGFFEIVHVENTGAAFGMLSDQPWAMYVFIPFTLIAVGVLISLLRELPDEAVFMPVSLGLILAGAIGNFLDRAIYQSVTDFLRFYVESGGLADFLYEQFGTREWPSFNVADICIVVGVILFIGWELTVGRKLRAEEEAAEQAEAA